MLNPVSDICWECMFPITIAGVPITPSLDEEAKKATGHHGKPICVCPTGLPPPLSQRPGIPISFWNPQHMIEVVKDAFCFPFIGAGLVNPAKGALCGGSNKSTQSKPTGQTFFQAHVVVFSIGELLDILKDFVCFETIDLSFAYMTEVDPLWNDDSLAFINQPETLVFANYYAQLACTADSVMSNAGHPMSPLFWCEGSWGSVYPLTGHASNERIVEASALVAGRMTYKMARQLMLWDDAVTQCARIPMPIWIKSHYKLQIARPILGMQCIPIGRSSMIWGPAKNPTIPGADNFLYMLFNKVRCCAL